MLLRSLLLAVLVAGGAAQSVDEEESVSFGGSQGLGSGNGIVDDEDLAGSGLPPDREYATTPSLPHRFTSRLPSTTSARKSVSTIVTQRPKIEMPATIGTTTSRRPVQQGGFGNKEEGSTPVDNQLIIVLLVSLIAALLLLIVAVLVCKGCNSKKRTYRTESKEASANGLLQKTDY